MPAKQLSRKQLNKYSQVAAAFVAGTALLFGPAMSPAIAQQRSPQGTGGPQTIAASSTTEASYQTLYVNPAAGSDSASGRENQPLQTVTRALELAAPNTVVVLAPGRYTRATGEVFPLQLKPGVTIQGTPGSRDRTAIIEGGGNFDSPLRSQQNAAIIAADRAGIAQVAISNPDGYGVWIESASPTILETALVGNSQTGIYVAGGSPRVENSYFSGNQVAGLIILGASNANIQGNTFESTGDAIRVIDRATPSITGNRMTNNAAGLVVIGEANPTLRDNQMTSNRRNDVVEVASSTQDISSPSALSLAEEQAQGQAVPQAVANVSTAQAVPVPADAIPGERGGNFSLAPLQPTVQVATNPNSDRAVRLRTTSQPGMPERLPVRSAPPLPVLEASSTLEADAVPGLVNGRLADDNLTDSDLLSPAEEESTTIAVIPSDAALETSSETVSEESDLLAEADSQSIQEDLRPAGAPGAALDALQSGVPIASRAANDGNPDSFRIRRRRRRADDDRPTEESVESRPAPVNNNRLAVPNTSIPVGSGGSSVIFSAPRSGVGAPPAPPSRAQALGLYYRVFVNASDPFMQDEVREVVPDAFRTQFEGRTVMQVGAFPTEDEAEDRQRLLEDNGLDARIEYVR